MTKTIFTAGMYFHNNMNKILDQHVWIVLWELKTLERNYAANEREALACLLAMEHWEKFLLGRKFTLRTDHKPLQSLLKPANRRQSSKFERWREWLSHFDFETVYLPGAQNQTADALSRLKDTAASLDVKGITYDDLQQMATADPIYGALTGYVKNGWPQKHLIPVELKGWHQHRDKLHWYGKLLHWGKESSHQSHPRRTSSEKLTRDTQASCDEETLKTDVLVAWHDNTAGGTCQVLPAMPEVNKVKTSSPHAKYNDTQSTVAAKQWAVDITGPFWNGRYLIVALDSATNYPVILDTTSTTSQTIIRWMQELFALYRNPDAVLTDNRRQFISKEFQDFLKSRDIHHYTSVVYNPQENGQVEGFNRYLKHGVQTFDDSTSWTEGIQQLLKAYRMTPKGDDGQSPASLFLGHEVWGDERPNMTPPSRRTLTESKESPKHGLKGHRE